MNLPPRTGARFSGWRSTVTDASLSDVHSSVQVNPNASWFRRLLAFVGPGFLVSVGYMDPGNWATAIAGGAQFGYTLLSVALLSNIMAIVLQSLCARLAVGSGRDLAQACRDAWPKPVVLGLWLFAEIAIIATDIAEVVGTAIGLQLLFGLPLEIGVLLTGLDVFLILLLQKLGFRWVEAFVLSLLLVIFASFFIQIFLARPEWAGVVQGMVPNPEIIRNPAMLYLAIGIIGATVMPHNLYLHSGIVQTRTLGETVPERRSALGFATIDSTLALMLALIINGSILVLSAATFHRAGQTSITDLGDAHAMLAPLLGSGLAPMLFAIALLACGLNSSITATLAGQIVMEGFLRLRISPVLRRFITRALAIVPAILVTLWYGEDGTGKLLVFTQVILALQLPFAVVPLVLFTSQKARMGEFFAPRWLTLVAWLIAGLIIALNVKLVVDFISTF